MPRTTPYSRIAITLPKRDLAAADRLAREQDRSRSWVIAEALRRYAAQAAELQPEVRATARGRDAIPPGLDEWRLHQLRSDLQVPVEERVREAELRLLEVPDSRRSKRVAERPLPAPLDRFQTKLALVGSLLHEAGARYVLVGARALQVWGTSRATEDTDILIEPTVRNARRVLKGLSRLGFGVADDILAEDVLSRPVTIVGDTPRVDILTRAWNLTWQEAAPRAVVFTIEGVEIPTASIDDLIASKRTGRLQDAADIQVLEAIRDERNGRGLG